MHELAIMEDILEISLKFAERNSAQKIIRVNLVIGGLSDIVPSWAQMFFQMVSKDTIAENAELAIESVPARLRCSDCGRVTVFDRDHPIMMCRNCGSENISFVSGREFRIQSIEIV